MLSAPSVSATEWLEDVLPNEPSWRQEDTVRLAPILAAHGVDLLDVSTGGNSSRGRMSLLTHIAGYQAPFSEAAKKAVGGKMLVSAVGKISEGKLAQSILDKVRQSGSCFCFRAL